MYPAAPLVHFLLESLGVLLAMALYRRLRRGATDPIGDTERTWLLIAAAFGAFAGSRLLGGLEDIDLFLSGGGELGWPYYLQAKTIVGGLLGGLWAVEGAKPLLGVRARSGDLYVFPLLLAMGIGRLGCLQMGILEPTYGLPTDSWLGMDLGDGIPRHPTALYEIGVLTLLGGALLLIKRTGHPRPGGLFMLFMVGYLSWRFGVGFLQPHSSYWYSLGSIQIACLVGLSWYAYDWLPGGLGPTSGTAR